MQKHEGYPSQTPDEAHPAHAESLALQRRTWTSPVVEEVPYSRTESTTTGTGGDALSYS